MKSPFDNIGIYRAIMSGLYLSLNISKCTENKMADESEVNDKLVELLEYLRGDSGLKKSSKSKKEALDKGATKAAEAMKLLHGSTGDAAFALRKFGHSLSTALGLGSIGVVINGLISSFTDMTRTFNKMSDVGMLFGGSLFEMQRQAGASGVSLEEFARQLEKGSTLASLMTDKQAEAGLNLGKFQKAVRDSLQPFGYFGMTMSQVNDQSLEMAESMRLTGHLDKLNSEKNISTISSTISVVSSWSQALGKSRDAILKITNSAMRDPGAAFRLATMTDKQQEAYTKIIAGIGAMPGEAGEALSGILKEIIETGSEFSEGAAKLRSVGLTDVVASLDALKDMANDENADPRQIAILTHRIKDQIKSRQKTLLELNKVPELKPGTQLAMRIGNALNNLPNVETMVQKTTEAMNTHFDAVTQQALMFETNFQDFTGAFRKGLWGALASMMPITGRNDEEKQKSIQDNIDAIKKNVTEFATVTGGFLGVFLEAVPAFTKIVSVLGAGFKKLNDFLAPVLGQDWAGFTLIAGTIAGLVGLRTALKRFFVPREARIDAAIAKIYSGNVSGGGADVSFDEEKRKGGKIRRKGIRGAIGRFTDRVKGSTGRMGGVKALGSGVVGAMKGSMGGVGKVLKVAGSGLLGGFKFLGRGIIGAVVGLAVDGLLTLLPSFKGKDTISSMARYAGFGATIGSLIPGVGTLVGGLIGAIVGLVVENFTEIASGAESLWRGTKGVLASVWKFVTGIAQAIWDGIWNLMPGAVKRLFGSSDAPLTPDQREKAINAPVTSDEGAEELNQRLKVVADQLAVDHSLPNDPTLNEEIARLLKKQNDLLEAQTALQAKNNDLQKRTSLFGGLPYAPGL